MSIIYCSVVSVCIVISFYIVWLWFWILISGNGVCGSLRVIIELSII